MKDKKIIVTGPVGAGKTTAIQTISDIQMVNTDEKASDITKAKKPRTTVAMDYGYVNLGEHERVHLYGTPGQKRFDFMWEVLSEGALGLILLLDNSKPKPQKDLALYTRFFKDNIKKGKLVIGVTMFDKKTTPTLDDYRQWIDGLSIDAPVFSVDARVHQDVYSLVQVLASMLEEKERPSAVA
ncbi:MAG: GTP-binding protein [Thiothrix sp.]|nr:MAG: GTP-binding protein [Thiothrix sp.]